MLLAALELGYSRAQNSVKTWREQVQNRVVRAATQDRELKRLPRELSDRRRRHHVRRRRHHQRHQR